MTVKRTSRWGVATLGVATATLTLGALASPVAADTPTERGESTADRPDTFTSAFTVDATPEQVVENANGDPAGVDGAEGQFTFLVNSDDEIICWDITVTGLATEYQSAAKTATHIHQNAAGENGPPRVAFPNPGPVTDDADDVRTSSGCADGPFTTGVAPNGTDTGDGFALAQLEENPAGFSADTHTTDAVSGSVRGQLVFDPAALAAANGIEDGDDDGDDAGDDTGAGADGDRQVPVGGVDTGAGGTASGTPVAPLAALMLGGLGAVGLVAARRRLGAGA